MKIMKIIQCLLAIFVIFCFYQSAFSGGPDPGPCTDPLPVPDAGKFIRGEFTAALDKGPCQQELCPHYNAHLVLKFGNQTHLFSFTASLGDSNLCAYTAEDLMEIFAFAPCDMNIGGAFGLSGVPVIVSLDIKHQDFCSSMDEMIQGEIVIRVVPLE